MASLNNTKIVVTGGAGFIGSHLVGRLIQNKAHVWIIDNNYKQFSLRTYNPEIKKAKQLKIDIRNKSNVSKALDKIRPDFIYHLAAEAIVTNSFANPYRTFQTNIMGTVNILETLRNSKYIKAIIVASSDKAYGKTKSVYTESSPLKGDHPYDVSKSSADLIAQTYFESYRMPVVVTRFGNVYGEGDFHFDRIIPGICKAIYQNKVFEIRSNGKFIRDYIYVGDVVEGYCLLLSKLNKTIGNAYNFSSSDTVSVIDVVKIFSKVRKEKIPIKILNNQNNEIPYQHLNDRKIKKLGWKQRYTLRAALTSVYSWYELYLRFTSN